MLQVKSNKIKQLNKKEDKFADLNSYNDLRLQNEEDKINFKSNEDVAKEYKSISDKTHLLISGLLKKKDNLQKTKIQKEGEEDTNNNQEFNTQSFNLKQEDESINKLKEDINKENLKDFKFKSSVTEKKEEKEEKNNNNNKLNNEKNNKDNNSDNNQEIENIKKDIKHKRFSDLFKFKEPDRIILKSYEKQLNTTFIDNQNNKLSFSS